MEARDDVPAPQQAERQVTITRTIDVPRSLVFKVWTDPKHMAQWWGPRGFTNPVCKLDPRPGGKIRIDMTAPDGTVYPMTGEFREVVEPERLVFLAVAEDRDGHPHLESLTTVTFEEQAGKTRLTVEAHAYGLDAVAPQMLGGMQEGWTQSLERLAALAERTHS